MIAYFGARSTPKGVKNVCVRRVRAVCVWCVRLFDADEATDERDTVELLPGELVGLVVGIVGDDEDVVGIAARLDAFDDGALDGVEDVGFAPLEEDVGERDPLAGDEIAAAIGWLHGVARDADHEVGTPKSRYDIAFALVLHGALLAHERSRKRVERQEGYAFGWAVGWYGDGAAGGLAGAIVVGHGRRRVGFQHRSSASEEPIS